MFKLKSIEPTEADHQVSLVKYAKTQWWGDFLIHHPNEQYLLSTDSRKWGVLHKLRQLGLRPGCPDLLLMLPSQGYHGFFLELKRRTVAKLPYYQQAFLDRARAVGYKAEWSNDLSTSIKMLDEYAKAHDKQVTKINCRFCEGTAVYRAKRCRACIGTGKDWKA